MRNWSDQGTLPVHRTQGGHRRFRRGEVDLWLQAQRDDGDNESQSRLVIQNALKSTRMRISEGLLESEGWYQKLDENAREQYRRSGRSLLQGLLGYLASDGEGARAEARALGYEYASRGWRHGLSCSEATHALMFFRNLLMDLMLSVYEAAAVRLAVGLERYVPQGWRIHRRNPAHPAGDLRRLPARQPVKRESKRFTPSRWSEYLVPALLVLVSIGLLVTLAIVILSLAGLTPGA